MNPFKNYRESIIIKDHIKLKHVIVGDYSYYSGHYDSKSFEECVMFLDELDDDTNFNKIDRLIVGKFCSIATGVKFMLGGNQGHNYNWISTYPLDFLDDDFDNYQSLSPKAYQLKGDTIIGNDVWIGAEAMIMPGVQIADGSVIAARSVITKNIGAYEIWGGNPARLIKKRFSDEKIIKLLEIKWWDLDISKIRENLALIRSCDVDGLWTELKKDPT
ncbi:MAG: CatB-related O-acetyltransferase [Janthinobacterium lividum]